MLIQVAYANKIQQKVISLNVIEGYKVLDVIRLSNIDKYFKEINLDDDSALLVGVYGKKIDLYTYELQDGDRIEIYRPLLKTPNQKRLERMNQKTNNK